MRKTRTITLVIFVLLLAALLSALLIKAFIDPGGEGAFSGARFVLAGAEKP